MIRVGVSLVCDRINEFGGWVRAAETAGVDAIGLSDSPCLYPETYVQATIVALETSSVMFGPRVTNPMTRHPSVTAAAMVAVDDLAGGQRAILGIGAGDSAVHSIGERKATLAELREYVLAVKACFAHGVATYHGHHFEVPQAKRQIPVYLAASGPRGLQLAGEIADGVIVGGGVSEELVSAALGHLASGAAHAGRRLDDLDVWWLMGASVGSTEEGSLEAMKPFLASVANACFRSGFDGKGLPKEVTSPLRRLVHGYDFGQHAIPGATRNAALVEELGLTEYLADRFAITGTPAVFAEKVASAATLGAEQLWFTMPLPDKYGFLDALGTTIIPRLRAA